MISEPERLESDLILLRLTKEWSFIIQISWLLILISGAIIALMIAIRVIWNRRTISKYEIDRAEFGLGNQKISLRPNETDRQIAYSIWVELSTRKIGLPIHHEDDVIYEIYDSWYNFFGVTRELIKSIPVSKVRNESTRNIINLSIELLNEGLRPHLTKWQARFRKWYVREVEEHPELSPQEIQIKFPQYDELSKDLIQVNERLIKYREKMYELVTGD